ncbi:NAD(P)H-binding protein [Mucilaginibacter antarcticus]|uniref:NAD(P)H-binding protein n=1 Tax=Mucilaginibacter antarcticus TaxID=1855725 RepID=A0ABW5XNK1_9SPHI
MTKKAIIVGASGLIGSNLLDILLTQTDYDEVLVIARKKSKNKNIKLSQLVIDFDKLDDFKDQITGNVLFCCLGTTRKATPDLADYRKIDHDYPVKLAEIALENGISQFHYVSAIGANSRSSNFYTKIKGDAEDDLKQVGLKSLQIYEPSLLIGNRKKRRMIESIASILMTIINPLLLGGLRKYRAIKAINVAKAMFKQSLKNKVGIQIYTTDQIQKRA